MHVYAKLNRPILLGCCHTELPGSSSRSKIVNATSYNFCSSYQGLEGHSSPRWFFPWRKLQALQWDSISLHQAGGDWSSPGSGLPSPLTEGQGSSGKSHQWPPPMWLALPSPCPVLPPPALSAITDGQSCWSTIHTYQQCWGTTPTDTVLDQGVFFFWVP